VVVANPIVTEAVPEYSPSTFFLQELSKNEDNRVIEKNSLVCISSVS
jgi:hypothetical protein